MNKKKTNVKRLAFEKKQEKEGRNIVNWIFGCLVVVAVAYMAYAIWSFS
jgi:hypothetical protein